MVGNRIKLLREELGLKQEDLAKKLSVSPSSIGMYERNLREPNDELTLKFSNFFDVSVDYLLGKTDIRNHQEPNDSLGLAEIGFDINNYTPPSKAQKEQIKAMIEIILKENKKKKDI